MVRVTLGDQGGWFKDKHERVVGDEKTTLFWEDSWVEGASR